MSAFTDADEGRQVMTSVFQQLDLSMLPVFQVVYSYRFTDADFSCTAVLRGGSSQLVEGILPESETTIETTSAIFDLVMTGRMNLIAAHLSGQVKVLGSLGTAFKLRTLVPALSKAYRAVIAKRPAASQQ